jgi:hypothetical protein
VIRGLQNLSALDLAHNNLEFQRIPFWNINLQCNS